MERNLPPAGALPLHTNSGHFYKLPSGVVVPSVTTILGGAYPKNKYYLRWLANQGGHDNAERTVTAAGNTGSAVHDAIVSIFDGVKLPRDDYSQEEQNSITAFRKWLGEYNPKVIWREQRVFSEEHHYAGTADLFCRIGHQHWLIDHKTSARAYKNYRLQLLAYAHALRENGIQAQHLAILRLDKKTAKFEWVPLEYSEQEFQIFLSCYELWRYSTTEV